MIAIYKRFEVYTLLFNILTHIPFSNNLITIITKVIRARCNPRDFQYMKDLAIQFFSDNIDFVYLEKDIHLEKIKPDERVILLWPDSIGVNWDKTEKLLLTNQCRIDILNGRKRYFQLSQANYPSIKSKRLLEKYFIGEIFFSLLFILFTPLFLIVDLIKGKY